MSKYLERARELRAIVTPHYNCGQSVVLPFAEDAGLTEAQALGRERKPHCDALVYEVVTLVEKLLREAGKL